MGIESTTADPRWIAVAARDAAQDGKFFYSVETTGVYCRPSCAAKLARPENVRFHSTCEDAERAGFRPCKRCKPRGPSLLQEHAARIAAACRTIETSEQPPSLEALAAGAGLSRYHFHRVFLKLTGVTPKQYAAAHRAERVRSGLAAGASVTETIYDAGYQSSGRFYAASNEVLGMTPSAYRRGGMREEIRFAVAQCALGCVLVAAGDRGICAIQFGSDQDSLATDLRRRFPHARLIAGDDAFGARVSQVVAMIESPGTRLDLPLDIRGTAFQQRVWQALRAIPAGSTASYSQVAAAIGAPQSARAVAQACGANPLAVAIPCHRVVGKGGALSGYRWGVERKRALLERESRD